MEFGFNAKSSKPVWVRTIREVAPGNDVQGATGGYAAATWNRPEYVNVRESDSISSEIVHALAKPADERKHYVVDAKSESGKLLHTSYSFDQTKVTVKTKPPDSALLHLLAPISWGARKALAGKYSKKEVEATKYYMTGRTLAQNVTKTVTYRPATMGDIYEAGAASSRYIG